MQYFTSKLRLFMFLLVAGSLFTACSDNEPVAKKKPIPPLISNGGNSSQRLAASGLDKSPMDMAFFPVDYPKLNMSHEVTQPPIARVIYSRPQRDGRVIFGNLISYGKRWRLGANEATEIEFFKDVTIQNKKVRKGRYTLYCIPQPNDWTLILNSDLYTWGLKIDSTRDLMQFDVPVAKTQYPFEAFTMKFMDKGDRQMQLMMAWDSVAAMLPVSY